ncbi:MAG TPA: hypothetical protein VGF75_01590 [Candidatus Saccharimonadales bacterium]|jgi:hypothetical protein
MKISVIPAQITTVEDRIAGSLNLTQLLLLAIPLFITAAIFFVLPPVGHYSLYKIIISGLVSVASGSLAIRVNGKLVLNLIKLRLEYELRPKLYVYEKQPTNQTESELPPTQEIKSSAIGLNYKTLALTNNAKNRGHRLLHDEGYSVVFSNKTGGLSVKVDTA